MRDHVQDASNMTSNVLIRNLNQKVSLCLKLVSKRSKPNKGITQDQMYNEPTDDVYFQSKNPGHWINDSPHSRYSSFDSTQSEVRYVPFDNACSYPRNNFGPPPAFAASDSQIKVLSHVCDMILTNNQDFFTPKLKTQYPAHVPYPHASERFYTVGQHANPYYHRQP